MQRLRTLSEAECYARCYGRRSDESVRVLEVESQASRLERELSGEFLRALFDDKLESREPEAA